MINTVKRERKYHFPVRKQQAGETRERILDAARRLVHQNFLGILNDAGVLPIVRLDVAL